MTQKEIKHRKYVARKRSKARVRRGKYLTLRNRTSKTKRGGLIYPSKPNQKPKEDD
jgi:hypothetical protein